MKYVWNVNDSLRVSATASTATLSGRNHAIHRGAKDKQRFHEGFEGNGIWVGFAEMYLFDANFHNFLLSNFDLILFSNFLESQ